MPLLLGSSTTTLNADTPLLEANPRSADCHQPDGRVHLGLESQVKVLRARAEEVPGRFDVVTARAVAPLEKLLGWTTGLFLPDGELLALKGETAADEVAAAQDFLSRKKLSAETLTVRALPQAEPTHVVRIRAAR